MSSHLAYTIFRLSNPVGKTNNTTTIINFLVKNIVEQHSFELWQNASRNIIDIDDMFLLCHEVLQNKMYRNNIVNIANPYNYSIGRIVSCIEKHFTIKARYILKDKGSSPQIDVSGIAPLFKKFNINFEGDYLDRLLQKYFPV